MSLLSDVIRILTLDCRQSSRLLSESLDRPLRWPERVAVSLHQLGCWSCRRLKRQFQFLHDAARRIDRDHLASGAGDAESLRLLSAQAKQRMKAALQQSRDEQ